MTGILGTIKPPDVLEIDDRVQEVLALTEYEPRDRAKAAAALIEEHARHEAGVDWDVPLHIPLEWQHRLFVFSSVHTEPATINYMAEVRDPKSLDILRTAFNAQFDGDEAVAEAAFEAYWHLDRA